MAMIQKMRLQYFKQILTKVHHVILSGVRHDEGVANEVEGSLVGQKILRLRKSSLSRRFAPLRMTGQLCFVRALLIPILAVSISSGSAFGQTMVTAGQAGVQRVLADNYMGVGFSASFVSGMGLTLKDHLPYSPIAIQITGMPFKDGNVGMYDIGGELQYDLFLGYTRLYLVGAAGYYYYSDGSPNNNYQNGYNGNNTNTNNSSGNELSSPYRLGFGLGYEIPYGRNVGMTLNLMFTAFMPSGDILPTPSIGFVGYFR
jgi:hypothetical protein